MIKDIQNRTLQYPSDFKPPESISDIQKIFEAHDFFDGRMIAGSKWQYTEKHPEDLIIFNANIVIPNYGKIWYGDVNLTKDYKVLKRIAECLNETLYILWEMDCRFGSENKPISELIEKAVWSTDEEKPTKEWYLKKMEINKK